MKYYVLFLPFLVLFSLSATAEKQNTRIPDYPVPYTLPEVKSIKSTLNRVRKYYESTGKREIVNVKSGKKIKTLEEPNKHAKVADGFASEWSYTNGVVLSAFNYIDDELQEKQYFENNIEFFNFVVKYIPYFESQAKRFGKKEKIPNWGRILNFHALDDCGSIGAALIKTYLKTKNPDYLPLIQRIDQHVSNNQFRLSDGTLARHRPQYESIWADDLYMSVPFLANMGVLTGKNAYFDDAIKQILQMADRLYIPEKELFDHGWSVTSADYDPRFFWGRANGWTLMSMAELLSVLPQDYPGRDKVLHLYRSMIRSLANLQDGTGFWHNLLDKSNTFYETSATAMFTFAIAKGINENWISHVYGPTAIAGWNAIATRIQQNGAVDGTVEGTTFAHDNTYYFYRGTSIYATHGYGPVLYAGMELIRLLQNDTLIIKEARPNSINSTFHFLKKAEWPNDKH